MAMAGLENVAIYGRFGSPAEVLGPELAVRPEGAKSPVEEEATQRIVD
jgi:hypothetical protein